MKNAIIFAGLLLGTTANAQQATLVYRLGKDTVAVEQFTRTPTRLTGDMISRAGAALFRLQYDVTIGANGRPTMATLRRRQGDGTQAPNAPTETRLRFTADSVHREIAWADSVQKRSFAAAGATVAIPTFNYGLLELVYGARRAGAIDSIPAFGLTGNPSIGGLVSVGGDTMRVRGGGYAMLVRFDRDGRILSVDGSLTTNKVLATRSTAPLDFAALAARMKPTGVLSVRANATLTFGQSPIFIDYGRPQVRERTVWGGVLVPFDSVWRAGANAATHLATSLPLAFGTVSIQPGLYSLWIQHTRTGTFLIINKGVGQWGTSYDPAQDIGRVQMPMAAAPEFVEEYTITIRALPQNRGAIDFAWGPSVVTATYDIRR
jgi:hypothetical protein